MHLLKQNNSNLLLKKHLCTCHNSPMTYWYDVTLNFYNQKSIRITLIFHWNCYIINFSFKLKDEKDFKVRILLVSHTKPIHKHSTNPNDNMQTQHIKGPKTNQPREKMECIISKLLTASCTKYVHYNPKTFFLSSQFSLPCLKNSSSHTNLMT